MKSFIQASSSLLFVFVLILGRNAGAESSPPEIRTPATILFIGDSFTGYQGGIYTHVEKLASAAMPTPASLKTEAVVVGGAPLKRLWELKDAAKAINTGKFNVVVFQDDIPEINVDYFRQYARLFIEEARKNRATPVLYMTWAYKRLGWISMREIAAAHRTLADELHIEVAPVGLAWEEPEDTVVKCAYPIDIHQPDGSSTRFEHGEELPYGIPFGCLIPEDLPNVLAAGRCISATHEAAGSFRVMPTCMAIGEAAGTAVALAHRNNASVGQVSAADIRTALDAALAAP